MNVTFTDRFHQENKSNKAKVLWPLVKSSIGKMSKPKPGAPDWNPGYKLVVKTMTAFMDSIASHELPDVHGIQSLTGSVPQIAAPRRAIIEPMKVESNPKVIEFLKAQQITEWPSSASDITSVPAEFLYHPQSKESPNALLFFHGGVYCLGSMEIYRINSYSLSKWGNCKVFGVNYRLAPMNPFPCAVIDAVSAYLYLLESYPPENIAIMGDSAGGGLTIATMLVLRDMGYPLPAGGYCQSPWVDLSHSFPSFSNDSAIDFLPGDNIKDKRLFDRLHYYVCNDDLKLSYVSPYWAEDLSQLPPILIQCGSSERLYDEILAFAKKTSNHSTSGVQVEIYKYHVHVFQMLRVFNGSKQALINAGRFLRDLFENRPKTASNTVEVFSFQGATQEKHPLDSWTE